MAHPKGMSNLLMNGAKMKEVTKNILVLLHLTR